MYKTFELKRNFIYVGNDMYEVVRTLRDDRTIDVKQWRDDLGAETTFRKEGLLFFVNKVEDIEFEEISAIKTDNERTESSSVE